MSEHPEPDARPVAAVVILAAGEGKRMKSARSKLLHEVAGHSLLSYAVSAATNLQPEHVVVVVGHGRDQVEAHLGEIAPHVTTAVQEQQLGTGHAVQVALERLGALTGEVVVTYGDVPMLASETLAALLDEHRRRQAAVTVLTAEVPDPTGYGRILRDADGAVQGIVEHRDADDAQRAIREINSGIYVFEAETLQSALAELTPTNDQGELYLTDVLGLARRDGRTVAALVTDDLWQTEGVNDRIQLAAINAEMNRRILHRWMRAGVTVIDPATTWVHASVDLAPDVTLLPNTSLEGATSVGRRRDHRPGHHADRRRGGRERHAWSGPTGAQRDRRGGQAWARTRSCGPAPCSAPAARSAPSWRPRTPRWAPGPRCRT